MEQVFASPFRMFDAGAESGRRDAAHNALAQYAMPAMQGDKAALNALAATSPLAAMQIHGQLQDRQRQDARLAMEQERLGMARDAAAREIERLGEAEALQEFQRDVQVYSTALRAYEAGDRATFDRLTRGNPDYEGVTWDTFPQFQPEAEIALEGAILAFENRPEPEGPADEYQRYAQEEMAAGRKPLTRMEFIREKGNATRAQTNIINNTGQAVDPRPLVGKPPEGFQRVWDEEAGSWVDQPIPGSDTAKERSGDERALEMSVSDYQRKFDIVDGNLSKAIEMLDDKGRWVAGMGSVLSGIPESSALDFQSILDTIKANLGFEELSAMRDASPTGGALGQVSEREIAFLQAIQGNLDAAQSPQQLLAVLKEIQTRRRGFAEERKRILQGDQANATGGISLSGDDLRLFEKYAVPSGQ